MSKEELIFKISQLHQLMKSWQVDSPPNHLLTAAILEIETIVDPLTLAKNAKLPTFAKPSSKRKPRG